MVGKRVIEKRDDKRDAIRLIEMALHTISTAVDSAGDTIDVREALALCKSNAANARQVLAHLKKEVLP